jgi:hypothetical protein
MTLPLAHTLTHTLTYTDPASWVATVRHALEKLPQDSLTETQRVDLSTALVWIEEALEVPSEDDIADHEAVEMRRQGYEVTPDGTKWTLEVEPIEER